MPNVFAGSAGPDRGNFQVPNRSCGHWNFERRMFVDVGGCGPPTCLDIIERLESLADRQGFRQHVNNTVSPGKSRLYDAIEESGRDVDAAVRDAFVDRIGSGQALEAVFTGIVRNHAVQGNGVFVVNPEDVRSFGIHAQVGNEATGRRGALIRPNIRQFPVAYPGDGIIAPCKAQQDRRRAAKPPESIEYEDLGVCLVYDRKRHSTVVARIGDPIRQLPGASGPGFAREVRPFGVRGHCRLACLERPLGLRGLDGVRCARGRSVDGIPS